MTRYYLILHPKSANEREVPIRADTIEQARKSAISYFQKNGIGMGKEIAIKTNGKIVGMVVCDYKWPKPSEYTYICPNGILYLKTDGTIKILD